MFDSQENNCEKNFRIIMQNENAKPLNILFEGAILTMRLKRTEFKQEEVLCM